MGFGDIAKEALTKALEVYEGLSKLAAVVSQIEARVTDFRDETRKRLTDYEHRLDNKANAIEARADRKSEDFEARLRELESRMAKLEGRTSAALAEAFKSILSRHTDLGKALLETEDRMNDGGAARK